ncbi:hypothetical protein [Marinicella meishanensis]|uniref:hypothetical protein n=1 Tax=Marinicella meishanensis TaxID=2873263 RepID=UPI001CBA7EC3|nr:hypothetical protein [Marinicella sp. NBU2979]
MIKIESEKKIKLVYVPAFYPREGDTWLEYDLAWADALPTLRRFLHHLWRMTRAEAVPKELFLQPGAFQAPILKEEDQLASTWAELY